MFRRVFRAIGVLAASTGLTWGGIAMFADPAFAACIVNVGTCTSNCTSVLNSGMCESGSCSVNVATCSGGNCTVNLGTCDPDCANAVNAGDCGSVRVGLCIGTGSATLSSGIAYFPNVTSNVAFTFSFNCTDGETLNGSGVLESASCGRSVGSGVIPGVGPFSIQTSGSMIALTGAATGGGNATPIPDTSRVPPGNNCSNGTANTFTLIGGAWILCASSVNTVCIRT